MTGAAPGRLRILHLAFEDHRRPGSGGGGIRTREINRRLAARHDITVVTSRYPGARARHEDGVQYRPLGLNLGHLASMATYHLAIPLHLLFRRPDLVVEDFAAPISSALVPLWTGVPTVAVVQWLAADETSKRYHLPFWWFEEAGMRLHGSFVAVSEAIAARLVQANPAADIRVVYAGVDCPGDVFWQPSTTEALVVFMGRLEFRPKGLDLLLDVVEQLRDLPGLHVVVAGDGRHRSQLEALIRERALDGTVDLIGRVDGRDKWELLARAAVVVQPSRYESFGLVAAEASAVGTPVVAWALPSFKEILGAHSGTLVPAFEVSAFADAVRARVLDAKDSATVESAQKVATEVRARFSWDRAAELQEKAYLAAASGSGGRRLALKRLMRLWRTTRQAVT